MQKDTKDYNILVIEDNPGDFTIVEDFLMEQILTPGIVHAKSFKEAEQYLLRKTIFDVILLDLSLPDKKGEQLVTEMINLCISCPIIIFTGYADIDFSIRSISQGVMDYMLKDDLSPASLYKSIVYAIERKKGIHILKASEKRYFDLFHLSPQPMCLYDSKTYLLKDINKAGTDQYGYSKDEFSQMTLFDLVPEEDRMTVMEYVKSQVRELNKTYAGKFRNFKKSGEIIEVETFSTPLIIEGRSVTLVVAVDVTEKNIYENKITKAIIKAQEDERYEIGGELHDNVCQILAASLLSLSMLKETLTGKEVRWFNSCAENINLAAAEIRNLSHRLAPAFFKESSVEQAFSLLLDSFNVDGRYEVELNVGESVEQSNMSVEMQLNLYRILQEQLKNIFKYAKADKIEVDLFLYNKRLKMRIYDNGKGFDLATAKKGIGIANMQRRATSFAGKFLIESEPGEGCTVLVDLPFE